jgi:hypothetical protein
VGFQYAPADEMMGRYDPAKLNEGPNRFDDGEEFFFISKPGTGLWADRSLFSGT